MKIQEKRGKLVKLNVAIIIAVVLACISSWKYVLSGGYIYLAEHFEVYKIENFMANVYPIWNEKMQKINFSDLPKIYLFSILIFISKLFNSYKFLQILLLVSPIAGSFISMYILSNYVIDKVVTYKLRDDFVVLISLVSAFVYTVNPWFISEPRIVGIRFTYAFLPLMLYSLLKLLEENDFKYGILLAVTVALTTNYRQMAIISLLLLIEILLFIIVNRNHVIRKASIKILVTLVILFLLLIGKILPSVIYFLNVQISAIKEFTLLSVTRVEVLKLFTTQTSIPPAMYFNLTYSDQMYMLFIVVAIVSFLYTLFPTCFNRNRVDYLLMPLIVIVIFTLFCTKNFNIDMLLIKFKAIGRLFRHAKWNTMPVVLSIATMVAYSTYILFLKIHKKIALYLVVILILFFASISAYPFFTGDMNGYWRPARVPEDYISVNDILSKHEQNVLWVPTFGTQKAVWVNASTPYDVGAPTGLFDIRSSEAPSWWYNYFYFFDYYLPINDWRASPLENFNNYDLLSEIYSTVGIKYLALHYDIRWIDKYKIRGLSNEYIRKIGDEITSSVFYKSVYKGKFVELIEINRNVSYLYVTNYALDINGRLTDLGSISALPDDKFPAVVFLDYWNFNYSNLFDDANFLIVRDSISIGLPSIVHDNRTIILRPASFTLQGNPMEGWAKSQVNSYSLQYYLWMNDVKWTWPFDYDAGLVFTLRQSHLNEEHLSSDGRILNSPEFRSMSVFLTVSHHNDTIIGKVAPGSWDKWIEAISAPIEVEDHNYYKIEFAVKGKNVIDFNAIVRYYNTNGELLGFDVLNRPLNGTFGYTSFSPIIYTPAGTKYIKVSFRVWQNRENYSFWEVRDFRIYDQSEFIEKNMLTMPFRVEVSGDYVILLRALKSSSGGLIKIWLDNECIADVNTRSNLTDFVWLKIGEFRLNAGEHELAIENVYGLNILNIILIVNKNIYEKTIKNAKLMIKSKDTLYILEAETDFCIRGGHEINDYESSNGAVIVSILSNEFVESHRIKESPTSWVFVPKIANPTPICPPPICRLKLKFTPSKAGSSAISSVFDGSIVHVFYEFKDVNATPVVVNWKLNNVNWSMYDSISIDFYGDGSNNTVSFWFYDNTSRVRFGLGQIKLDWTGWRNLVLDLGNRSRVTVKDFRIVIRWDGMEEGLGKHKVAIKDIKVVRKKGFELSRDLDILKDGDYTIAVRGTGKFRVYIDDSYCDLKFGEKYEWKSCVMHLNEGRHIMRIVSPKLNSRLDLVLIYSCNRSLESFFDHNVPAEILKYRKISPTKWVVKIRVKEPFMLAFTSGYDPFWTARVNGTVYRSIPLNGLINGFYIDKTGEYWVEIEYELQKYYDFGLVVSGVTFLVSFVYLVLVWRRGGKHANS